MTRTIPMLAAVTLLGLSPVLWAGPVEEVAEIAKPRVRMLEEGNLDGYMAAFADSAVFQSALSPFRIEGKEAIRAHFAQVFEQYPKRRILPRQPARRAYGDDLVVQNGYAVLYLTDQDDEVQTVFTRSSITWARIGGRWQIVDQHTSRLPTGD
jgi:uncharacterized protein (TIGR02246 family)